MKTIIILKKLITIYYYLLMVALVAGVITIPLALFKNQSYEISLFGSQIDIGALSNIKSALVVIVLGTVLYFYFRAIQLMQITVKTIEKGHYFSEDVIVNFKKMGSFFLISGVGFFVVDILLKFLLESHSSIGFGSSLFLFVITGLFFLFLSEVFKVAKDAKEENDLTV